jgi:hypothetical protein
LRDGERSRKRAKQLVQVPPTGADGADGDTHADGHAAPTGTPTTPTGTPTERRRRGDADGDTHHADGDHTTPTGTPTERHADGDTH